MIAPMTQTVSLRFGNDKVPLSDLRSSFASFGSLFCVGEAPRVAVQAPMKPRTFTGYGPLVSLRNIAESLHLFAVISNDPRDLLLGQGRLPSADPALAEKAGMHRALHETVRLLLCLEGAEGRVGDGPLEPIPRRVQAEELRHACEGVQRLVLQIFIAHDI